MDALARAGVRVLVRGADRLHVVADVDDAWAWDLWDERLADGVRHAEHGLPDGGRAFVKLYPRRPAHGVLRRLRGGRAEREGRGCLAFARAGLPVVSPILWGERRVRHLLEAGLVATRRVQRPTLADAFLESFDAGLLAGGVVLLARVHAAGLVHGDARLRNLLATEPEPTCCDLAQWRTAGPRAVARDLRAYLASASVLAGRDAPLDAWLDRYEARRALPGTRARLRRAIATAAARMRRA